MKHYSCTAIFFVALTACTSCIPCSAAETKTESQFELSYPTVGEIRKYSAEHSIYSYPINYLEEPSFTAPYSAGRLNEASLQNGLNMLNFCRYIAGLPADVELSENYNAAAQAGQLIDCMNSYLSHFPQKEDVPSDFPDDLFELGSRGNSNSNLSGLRKSFAVAMTAFMHDSDSSNLPHLGHRRWILNPPMQYAGFGYVGRSNTEGYIGCYVTDRQRKSTFVGDYVAWPPHNMPYWLYQGSNAGRNGAAFNRSNGYAFSVSLGSAYDKPQPDSVKVDLHSALKDETYHFESTGQNANSQMYLNVNPNVYGMPYCIIFKPGSIIFDVNDTLKVDISGITKKGVESPISYEVNIINVQTKSSLHTGDVNWDYATDKTDAELLLKWLSCNTEEIEWADWDNANRNQNKDTPEDKILDARDLSALKKYILNSQS